MWHLGLSFGYSFLSWSCPVDPSKISTSQVSKYVWDKIVPDLAVWAEHREFLEYWNTQKVDDLTTFFISAWWGDSKNLEEMEFSWWLLEGRLRQCKNVLPDGLNWLCYFAGSSKSHCEHSISFIFLETPHQVDMQNVVKC